MRRRANSGRTVRDQEIPLDNWLGTDGQACATVRIITNWEFDATYGSDADGRRGTPMTFVEHEATVLSVEDPDLNPVDLSTLSAEQIAVIEAAGVQFAEDTKDDEPDEYDDCDRAYDESRGA